LRASRRESESEGGFMAQMQSEARHGGKRK